MGDFHFNVNVRTNSGSRAKMANNEDSFLRPMAIQERKREIKELAMLKEEKLRAEHTQPEEDTLSPKETLEVQEEASVTVEASAEPAPTEELTIEEVPPIKTPAPKPKGGGVPGPTPRNDFTPEEKAAMLKRAKAHAVEVRARKK